MLHNFLTISPKACESYKLFVETNNESDKVLKLLLESGWEDFNLNVLPSLPERRSMSGANGYATANNFRTILELFSYHILGYDVNKKERLENGGVLGFTKYVFFSIESQKNYNLHAHILIWLEGIPVLHSDFNNQYENNLVGFKDRFEGWFLSILEGNKNNKKKNLGYINDVFLFRYITCR